MITLEGDYQEVDGERKEFTFKTNKGINLRLKNDKGEVLVLQSSQQPYTTVLRIIVKGKISINTGGDKDMVTVLGTVTLRRV